MNDVLNAVGNRLLARISGKGTNGRRWRYTLNERDAIKGLADIMFVAAPHMPKKRRPVLTVEDIFKCAGSLPSAASSLEQGSPSP